MSVHFSEITPDQHAVLSMSEKIDFLAQFRKAHAETIESLKKTGCVFVVFTAKGEILYQTSKTAEIVPEDTEQAIELYREGGLYTFGFGHLDM